MRKIISLSIIAGVVFCFNSVKAQDFHLSQYDAAALNHNPAMTGMFKGDYRFHGHYRTQWSAVATRPFQTGFFSFDSRINDKFSAGAHIANFNAGAGNYNALSFMISGSYLLTLNKAKTHFLSAGLQAGAFQKSLDFSSLYFENQYTQVGGGGFDQALSSNEPMGNQSMINHDANFGLLYFFAKQGARVQPFAGLTAYHLTRPRETFFGQDNILPMRFLFHGGASIGVSEKVELLPKVYYMHQKEANELTFSLMGHFYLSNPDIYLIGGLTYRNQDAAIVEAGAKVKRFIFRMSYDFNVSTLRLSSNGRGGSEFSLSYIFNKQNPNPIPSCPRL